MKKFIIFCGLVVSSYGAIAQNTFTFKNPNESKKVYVKTDTILFKCQYELILQELQGLKEKNALLEQNVRSLEKEKAQYEETNFDKFLNIQDTTIFGSQFKNVPEDIIPVRSREYYLLIRDIHDLNELLTGIENMSISQLSSLGNQLSKARHLIDEVNSFAQVENRRITDYLSENQKQYFRDLVKRYNTLNASFNRSSLQHN